MMNGSRMSQCMLKVVLNCDSMRYFLHLQAFLKMNVNSIRLPNSYLVFFPMFIRMVRETDAGGERN